MPEGTLSVKCHKSVMQGCGCALLYIQGGMKNCSGKDYCGNKVKSEVEDNTKSREG